MSRVLRLQNSLLGLALVSSVASAGGTTGNELLSWVNGATYERLKAAYYMDGIVDGINMAGLAAGKPVVCIPQGVNLGQVTDVVIKEMKNSPENRHMEAQVLIMVTLRNTWPCK